MNRMYSPAHLALEKRIVSLFAKAAIGASGAPTISSTSSKGVASIARNSAGKYTLTLSDVYNDLLMVNVLVEKASAEPAASSGVTSVLRSHTVASTKTVVVEFLDAAGAAIELASGCTLRVELKLKATTV